MTAKAVCRVAIGDNAVAAEGITCERMGTESCDPCRLVTLLRACFATKRVLDGGGGRSCLPD